MSIINLLASQNGLKGSEVNIQLAKTISDSNNFEAIKELIENLTNKDKKIQSDCIKVLYEIGYIRPKLIANYYSTFLLLISNKNNRLVWGSMVALLCIAELKHSEIYSSIEIIFATIKKGSVITIDCGVGILSKLNVHSDYSPTIEPVLQDILWHCPIKQLPQYMEKASISINENNKEIFINIIQKRIAECDKESQVKRLNKIIKTLNK